MVILSQKIESLIKAQINSITLLIDGLDRSTETNLVTVQEQLKFQSKIRGDYYDGRNDLLENCKLPDEISILITTTCMDAGVNILDTSIKTIIFNNVLRKDFRER